MADTVERASGTGTAMSESFPQTAGEAFRLKEVRLHMSASVTGAEDFTVTVNAADGVVHDLNIVTKRMTGVADYIFQADNPLIFEAGDVLDFAFANTDALNWGLKVIYN